VLGPAAGNAASARSLADLSAALTVRKEAPATIDGLNERFRGVVEWSTHEKSEYFWTLRPKTASPLARWAQAEFQPAVAAGSWTLTQVQLGLAKAKGAESPRCLRALSPKFKPA
jgi:hypothetical protein